jgi:hypothetical protein
LTSSGSSRRLLLKPRFERETIIKEARQSINLEKTVLLADILKSRRPGTQLTLEQTDTVDSLSKRGDFTSRRAGTQLTLEEIDTIDSLSQRGDLTLRRPGTQLTLKANGYSRQSIKAGRPHIE